MKLFFAAAEGQTSNGSGCPRILYADLLREEGAVNGLAPYPALLAAGGPSVLHGLNVFLDSGAWSVASGACPPIDLREYIAFVKANVGAFAVVASLDVLGDPVASERNYYEMLDAGVDSKTLLPCWHVGEPLDLAARYAQHAEYLAIGGLASRAKSRRVAEYIAHVWPTVKHRKVHLFGCGRAQPLTAFMPESADSSGWIVGASLGETYSLRSWPFLRNYDVTRGGSEFRPKDVAARVEEFRRFGFSWRELASFTEARLRYNIRVLLEFAARINRAGVARAARKDI